LSFQYRTINGRPARVCLREVGIGRCAVLPPLEPSSMWRTFRAVVTTDPATTRLRLFLYADGTAGGRSTVTEYRGLRIIDALPFGAVVYPRTTRESSTPAIHWQREGSSSLDVTVGPTDRPSLLLLRESFSDGWKLHEFPFGRAHQAEVDGYGNGWLVQPGPGLLGKITYAPDSWVHRARAVSALGVLAGGLWLFVRTHKRAYRVLSSFRRPWGPGHHDPQDRAVQGHSDVSTGDADGK